MARDSFIAAPIGAVEFAEKISDIFTCLASVAVGDLAIADPSNADTILAISTNVYDDIVFGLVIEKPSSTTCEVLFSGKVNSLSGLSLGKVVWVSASGVPTTTKPTTGHQQKLGVAIKSDSMYLSPSLEKVITS